jgi:hypothetical protein
MAITTGDGYIAAAKQTVLYTKTAGATVAASIRYTLQNTAGSPAALALAATTNPGALFVGGTTGFPTINTMSGNMYLTRVQYYATLTGHYEIWDKIWGMVGPGVTPAAPTTTTVTGPPSISGRVPGGTDYTGVRPFMEITTVLAGSTATTLQITYTNQNGTTAVSSPVITLGNYAVGRWIEIPLAAGDTGVQKIESVIIGGTAGTSGAYNIILAKMLWRARIGTALSGDIHGLDKTGMQQLFSTSALVCTVITDSGTTSGIPDFLFEVSAG